MMKLLILKLRYGVHLQVQKTGVLFALLRAKTDKNTRAFSCPVAITTNLSSKNYS